MKATLLLALLAAAVPAAAQERVPVVKGSIKATLKTRGCTDRQIEKIYRDVLHDNGREPVDEGVLDSPERLLRTALVKRDCDGKLYSTKVERKEEAKALEPAPPAPAPEPLKVKDPPTDPKPEAASSPSVQSATESSTWYKRPSIWILVAIFVGALALLRGRNRPRKISMLEAVGQLRKADLKQPEVKTVLPPEVRVEHWGKEVVFRERQKTTQAGTQTGYECPVCHTSVPVLMCRVHLQEKHPNYGRFSMSVVEVRRVLSKHTKRR